MKVALICPYDLDLPGGVQNQALGLAGALARRDHEVVLLAPGRAQRRVPKGVTLRLLGRSLAVRANGSVAPIAPYPSVLGATERALREGDFDVVHLHEPFVPGPCLVALYRSNAPALGTFHRAGVGRAYRRLRPVLRRLVARLDCCVAVSEAAARTLEEVSGASCAAIVANAVDLERFTPGPPRDQVGRLVFVGRHEPRKGLAVLLEAFSQLPGELELCIIGDGPQSQRLRSAFADRRISWLGRLGDDELAVQLGSSDVLVAPSLFGESFGVVLLEAMAAGCVIVASDLPGYRLAAGDAARYVDPGDPRALRAALVEVLGDTGNLVARRARARARAEQHSFTSLAERYESLYQDLIS